jgi:hypothetical protein
MQIPARFRIICIDGQDTSTRVFYKDDSGKEFELKGISAVSWGVKADGNTTIKIEAVGARLGGGSGCNL